MWQPGPCVRWITQIIAIKVLFIYLAFGHEV
uniref:Uncharacterized protein n=1 Tax=Setaria viridis TaxID=4556 RepID=A0A4U6V2C2_SETVI|nr:hypothetical protein SEVIR_4G233200v2 [Setaria viridis]